MPNAAAKGADGDGIEGHGVTGPWWRAATVARYEAAVIAAELCPVASPPSRTVVTTVPVPVASASQVGRAPNVGTDQVRPAKPPCPEGMCEAPSVAPALPAPARPMAVEPLTASQVRLHLTVPPEFLEKLEAARLALSHSLPGASAVDVITAGLDLLLQRDAKRKGLVESPRPAPPEEQAEPGAAHVPAAVRREVWQRDGGCCAWPLDSGGVCGSRLRLQFDHEVTLAEGGRSTSPNVRLLCAVHNRLAARERLGDRLMDRYCRDPRQAEPATTPRTPAEVPVPSSLGP